jgi:hypothetical protein
MCVKILKILLYLFLGKEKKEKNYKDLDFSNDLKEFTKISMLEFLNIYI